MRLPDKNQLRCNQPALLKIARMRTGRHFFVNSLLIRLSQAYIRLNAELTGVHKNRRQFSGSFPFHVGNRN